MLNNIKAIIVFAIILVSVLVYYSSKLYRLREGIKDLEVHIQHYFDTTDKRVNGYIEYATKVEKEKKELEKKLEKTSERVVAYFMFLTDEKGKYDSILQEEYLDDSAERSCSDVGLSHIFEDYTFTPNTLMLVTIDIVTNSTYSYEYGWEYDEEFIIVDQIELKGWE